MMTRDWYQTGLESGTVAQNQTEKEIDIIKIYLNDYNTNNILLGKEAKYLQAQT